MISYRHQCGVLSSTRTAAAHRGAMAARVSGLGAIVALIAVGLSSCPLPITSVMIEQLQDAVSPSVVIGYPTDGSAYSATVVVTGTASDTTGGEIGIGEIRRLTYETIPALVPGGEIDIDQKGAFSFSFPSTGFTGTMIVRVTAEDWSGHSSSASVTLHFAGNGIPTLAAKADNKQIEITWDPVPMSTSYSLLYTTNGYIPSDSYGNRMDNVSSPLVMTGLQNGAEHVFKLFSSSSQGDDNWSDAVRAIPLSAATLAPTVTGEYGQVNVNWSAMPTSYSFDVLRATAAGGTYGIIATGVNGTGITDTFVNPGEYYYYQVRPSIQDYIDSGAGAGTPGVFYPYGITRIGLSIFADNGGDVAARGDYAYVADRSDGLKSFDVSDRYNPVLLDTLDTGTAEGVWIHDNYAYVADGSTGLNIVSIVDPSNLTLEDTLTDFGSALGVEVSEGRLYVAATGSGLYVYDIDLTGSPDAPDLVGSFSTTFSVQDVAVEGTKVSLATGLGDLVVVETSALPFTEWGSIALTGQARAVDMKGGYAYVGCDSGGVRVVDVSTQTFSEVWSDDGIEATGYAQDVDVHRNYLYVADNNNAGLIYDVTVPDAPVFVTDLITGGSTTGVCADGDYIYFATGFEGLEIFISTIPTAPTVVGTNPAVISIKDLAVDGTYAFVTRNPSSIVALDVSDPTNPVEVGTLLSSTGNNYTGIAVGGGYAYVADHDGIIVIDVSDPAAMEDRGYCDIWDADVVELRGQYLYVTNWDTGLHIVDISDPWTPVVVGSTFWFFSGYMDVQGDYCYVTDNSEEQLRIFDVSNPSAPRLVFEDAVPGAWNVEVDGDHAFVASDSGPEYIYVYDVSDPAAATLLTPLPPGGLETSRIADYMHHDGHYLYISTSDYCVQVIDASDPAAPVIIGSNNDYTSPSGLAVSGRYAYIADSAGVAVIDLLPE